MAMWEANGPFIHLAVTALRGRAVAERSFRSLAFSTSSSVPGMEPDTPTSPDA